MLIEFEMDDSPLRWSEKIVISIDELLLFARGGYNVHPVFTLLFIIILILIIIMEGSNIHVLRLFSRGKAMS
jgi:hypothetical protein